MTTLEQRAKRAAIQRQIASDKLATQRTKAALNHLKNSNLRSSRLRRTGVYTTSKPERTLSTRDRIQAMAEARRRVEEYPLYATVQSSRIDHIVGEEYRLVMRSGNMEWNEKVEQWWRRRKDTLDIRNTRTWGDLLRCVQSRRDIDGDVGVILVNDGGGSAWVQLIEADRIRKKKNDSDGSNDGIEYDRWGMPVRYYVVDDIETPQVQSTYKAHDFILYANDPSYRIERKRGVSLYLTTLSLAEDLYETTEAMVQKSKNEAFIGLSFLFDGPSDNHFGSAQSVQVDDGSGVNYSQVQMVPGTNFVMNEGERVEVLESKSPPSNFLAFVNSIEGRIAFACGLTYELITGDFSRLNYSSSRAMLEIAKKKIRLEQFCLTQVASRIFRWALSIAIKAGELDDPPDDTSSTWYDHRWGCPGIPYINPAQEATAASRMVEIGLQSRAGILVDTSDRDIEDVADELAYEKKLFEARGLPIIVSSGAQPLQSAQSIEEPEK